MSSVQNNFDGGTNGVTITTGNSGGVSGDAFANVTGPFVFDTTGARSGLGGRVQIASSTAWRSYHSWTAVSQVAARVGFTFNGSVTNTVTLGGAVNTAFATVFKFNTNGSGKLVVQNASGSTLATSAAALTANTNYVVEYQVAPGADTSSGTIKLQLYTVAAPGTLLLNYSSTSVNAGTLNLLRGQLGNNDVVTSIDVTYDDIRYDLATLTPIGPPVGPGTAVFELGISISGADSSANNAQPASQAFSNARPGGTGVYPFSYEYEGVTSTSTHNHKTFGYLAGRGWKTVKIPTRWERLTQNASALTPDTLYAAEMALLDTEITEAAGQGMSVIIDLHNFGQYYADGAFTGQTAQTGYAQALGTTNAGVTWSNAFASFWGAMASHYLANPAVIGFHLMNEPNASVGLGNQTQANWYAAAQAAVTAIRAVDTAGRFILRVGGWAWSSCRSWTTLNGSPWITDPVGGPIWYEAHHYWDQNGSGIYTTYADALAAAVSHGYTTNFGGVTYPDALYAQVFDDLYQFRRWLPAGSSGVIGEAGWPNQANASASDQTSWNNLITAYLNYVGQLGSLNLDVWECGEKSWNNFAGNLLAIYASSNDTTTGVDTAGVYAPTLEAKLAAMNTNSSPVANAGADQIDIEPWDTVTLNGTASSDPDVGDTITYAWTQTAGTSVTLSDSTVAAPTFTAPGTIAGGTLTFSLVVTDNHGAASAADTVDVTILPVTERAVVGGVEVPVHTRVVESGGLQ